MSRPGADRSVAREARDVMAFGQEIGRVLSDGRIVGRAEPFAKVFPSSREVKRAVGLIAWAVLEDIALDARLDHAGRLVAETNVRRIADNVGLSKNAVARHLATLRDYGFVLHEERRCDATGRYGSSRYVLDPSACIERFTVTPPPPRTGTTPATAEDRAVAADPPCPSSWDTGTVSHVTGHREEGHKREVFAVEDLEEQQQQHERSVENASARGDGETAAAAFASLGLLNPDGAGERATADVDGDSGRDLRAAAACAERSSARRRDDSPHAEAGGQAAVPDEPSARDLLTHLGVDVEVADDLAAGCEREQVQAAIAAVPPTVRNPAGWVVAALRGRWHCTARASRQAGARRYFPTPGTHTPVASRTEEPDSALRLSAGDAGHEHGERRYDGWAQVVSAALDDEQLDEALRQVTTPVRALGRRSAPVARTQLLAWVAALVCDGAGDGDLAERLSAALAAGATPVPDEQLTAGLPVPPPAATRARADRDLTRRIAARLPRIDDLTPAATTEGAMP